ncbi:MULTISPECIES: hypothetical protein [unclassified Breznakia]|uniref:hypothetical protein n=1 Tax=unclassified Breznakia TaxID=2623764 RepID=UPI0024763025|nr:MULTISPECIES: hypothetical protein [unclassified Breznakia]MDH6365892.1 hypothetical protein [Breznakia sp. PH1-1]MDH6403176.1 hypothetical protein [Breznakia sp. PF1-11]MDH6410885.1 hypothetical protein [Breznakia sp. PFB1-11]MDH6413058.1 hypothetical protein [Breznakia sp. PFB1-14]MDH6415426.1 hypothetical protein [Breznakia sp. PFB1-4]
MKKSMKMLVAMCMSLMLILTGFTSSSKADETTANEETTSDQNITDENSQVEDTLSVNKEASLTLNALASTVEVGTSANYQLYFSLHGQGQVYSNVTLIVNLPEAIDQSDILFNQDVAELSLQGVVPTYDPNAKTLTYTFGSLEGGFESSTIIKVATRNGASLNDVVLTSSAKVVDAGNELANTSAQATLLSQYNGSISHKFLGIMKDDLLKETSSLHPGEQGVYGLGVSVNRFDAGSLEPLASSQVEVTYEMPEGLSYVSDTSAVTPTIDGQRISWLIPIDGNANDEYYFVKNFNLVLQVADDVEYFTQVETNAIANITYADASTVEFKTDATVMVVPDDSTDLPQYENGGGYLSTFRGPTDSIGGLGMKDNVNISTTDAALLGWGMYFTSNNATSPNAGMNAYDVFMNPDEHLNISKFYSGDYYFRPSTTYGTGKGELYPMEEAVNFSLSVRYVGESEWTRLVKRLEPSTLYTSEQLGIDSTKKIETIWMHAWAAQENGQNEEFADYLQYTQNNWQSLPAGLTTTNVAMYTTVDKGYIGSLESTGGISYSGWNAKYTIANGITKYVPEDLQATCDYDQLSDAWQSGLTPKTAQIIKEPEGISRYVKANAYLKDESNGIVGDGENTLYFDVVNDVASLYPMKGKFVDYALIDNDIIIGDVSLSTGGTITVIDTNYKNQGKTLVKLEYEQDVLAMNHLMRIAVPVHIDENAGYKFDVQMFGYLNEEFEVATTTNADGSITSKISDVEDFDQDGDTSEFAYSTHNTYMYRNAYEFIASALVGQDTFAQTGFVSTTDKNVNLALVVENVKGNPIKNLIAIDVLPTLDDTMVLNDEQRLSRFNVSLNGPVVLPKGYEDNFDVLYSTSSEPKVDGILDANVADHLQNLEQPNNITDAQWVSYDDVADKTQIKSFMIVQKEDSASIKESCLQFEVPLTANTLALTGTEALADRIAYNTFAVGVNDASVVESNEAAIVFEKTVVPPTEKPENPTEETPTQDDGPTTGDVSQSQILLLLLASASVVILFANRARRKQEN